MSPGTGGRAASAPLVLVAALAVVGLIALSGLGAVRWLRGERLGALHDASLTTLFEEAPIANRREAWFRVDRLDIGVVEARPLADGRLGLRVLVLSQDGSGECCTLTSPAAEIESRLGFESVSTDDGTEVEPPRLEEFTFALPAGSDPIEVDVVDLVTDTSIGSFEIELGDLRLPADPWAPLVP